MAHHLKVTQKPGYLHLKVTGDNTAANLSAFLAESVVRCREFGCRFALVEDALVGPDLDLDTLFDIIRTASDAAHSVVDRVAYVKTAPGHDPGIVRFAENIASNHDLNVQVFPSVKEAESWIAHHSRQASG